MVEAPGTAPVLRERPVPRPRRRRGARRGVRRADRPAGPALRLGAPPTSGCRPCRTSPACRASGWSRRGRPALRAGTPVWFATTAGMAAGRRQHARARGGARARRRGAACRGGPGAGRRARALRRRGVDGADLPRRAGGGGAGAGAGRRRRGRAGGRAARPAPRAPAGWSPRPGRRGPGSRRWRCGADVVVALDTDDVATPAGGRGWRADGPVDLVVDPLFGVPAAAALRALRPHGRLVNLGSSAAETAPLDSATLRSRSLRVLGYTNNELTPAQRAAALPTSSTRSWPAGSPSPTSPCRSRRHRGVDRAGRPRRAVPERPSPEEA